MVFSVNKCVGYYNIIDDPYTQLCLLNKVKTMNWKVFDLMLGLNETKFLIQHKSCECKFGLNECAWNSK